MSRLVVGRRPDPYLLALLAIALTAALWGTSFVAIKVAVAEVPPATLVLLRCAVAYLFLRPLIGRGGRERRPLDRSAFLLGATGIVVPVYLHNLAMHWSSAADGTLVHNGTYPVLTGLLAMAALGERLGRRLSLSLLASLAGVAVVALGGARLGDAAAGSGLLVAGTAAYALYTVIGRRAFAADAWLDQLVGMVRAAMVLLLPLAAVELALGGLPHPSPAAVLAVVYLGAGCSGLAHWLNALALRRLEASRVAVICNLEIPLGIAAGALLLGETVGVGHLAGTALIAGGAWLACHRPRRTIGPQRRSFNRSLEPTQRRGKPWTTARSGRRWSATGRTSRTRRWSTRFTTTT
jgi:drug/metabolite transporter (DMT)-like permease